MAKLHELLATDSSTKGQAQKTRTDLQHSFEKRRHLFSEKLVTHKYESDRADEIKDQSTIQSTILKEVDWITNIITKAIDVSFAIDIANTHANADIVLEDGSILAKEVPATALLQLEKRLREVNEFVKAIPTLDPAKGFERDTTREPGVYKAREVVKPRTEKVEEWIIVVPVTPQHPAQTQKITKDVRIGTIQELEWSSLITPAVKAEILERGESLLRAVSQARSRANDQDLDTKAHKIGKSLLDYVFQPLHA